MADALYSREEFLATWAKIYNLPPDPYHIAVFLINVKKNYQTALALIFGLSWANNKEYLGRATKYFSDVWPADGEATVEWLGQFVQHYITDVEKYPE